jgi:hypothetical protein
LRGETDDELGPDREADGRADRNFPSMAVFHVSIIDA